MKCMHFGKSVVVNSESLLIVCMVYTLYGVCV